MKDFFDTSVLVAAFWGGHVHHQASVTRLGTPNKKQSACGLHSLAEVYAVMTVLPVKPLIPPEQALLFVEELRSRLTLVSLDKRGILRRYPETAGRGFGNGRIYDALLLACGMKVKAQTVYTCNLKHYQPSPRRSTPASRLPRHKPTANSRPKVQIVT